MTKIKKNEEKKENKKEYTPIEVVYYKDLKDPYSKKNSKNVVFYKAFLTKKEYGEPIIIDTSQDIYFMTINDAISNTYSKFIRNQLDTTTNDQIKNILTSDNEVDLINDVSHYDGDFMDFLDIDGVSILKIIFDKKKLKSIPLYVPLGESQKASVTYLADDNGIMLNKGVLISLRDKVNDFKIEMSDYQINLLEVKYDKKNNCHIITKIDMTERN